MRAMYFAAYGQSLAGSCAARRTPRVRSSVIPLARSAILLREASYGGDVTTVMPSLLKYWVDKLASVVSVDSDNSKALRFHDLAPVKQLIAECRAAV
jgi:hypothetical protein